MTSSVTNRTELLMGEYDQESIMNMEFHNIPYRDYGLAFEKTYQEELVWHQNTTYVYDPFDASLPSLHSQRKTMQKDINRSAVFQHYLSRQLSDALEKERNCNAKLSALQFQIKLLRQSVAQLEQMGISHKSQKLTNIKYALQETLPIFTADMEHNMQQNLSRLEKLRQFSTIAKIKQHLDKQNLQLLDAQIANEIAKAARIGLHTH